MTSLTKKLYQFILRLPSWVVPAAVDKRADTERYSVDQFVKNVAAPLVGKGELLLDAGAGRMQFKGLFDHARYESTDFSDVFHKDSKDKHTFICSLDNIPKPDNTYEVILNTQVLEHVEYPQQVINEFYRVLKPGGKLFLTTNHMFPTHHAPYNFFFFTRFGLLSLFKNAGFEVRMLEARGGIFWLLAKISHTLPSYLFYQLAYDGFKKYSGFTPSIKKTPLLVVYIPIYLVLKILCAITSLIFFYLDPVDTQRDFTLGYSCYCVKPFA